MHINQIPMKTTIVTFILSLQCIMGFGQNLILNPDFENNDGLFCDHWYDRCGEELTYICENTPPEPVCDVLFYQDAPPADGTWSIGITGVGNSVPGTASTYVTGLDGTSNYLLNVWMKDAGNAFGGIEVGVLSQGQYSTIKTITADSTDWKFYTAGFPLNLDPSDSIQIKLSAFAAGPLFGVIHFDLVELIQLDTVNSLFHVEKVDMKAYPNPCNDHFMIELNDHTLGDYTITLFNAIGRQVKTVHSHQKITTIDVMNDENGLFYYQAKRSPDQKMIGSGRIVMAKAH